MFKLQLKKLSTKTKLLQTWWINESYVWENHWGNEWKLFWHAVDCLHSRVLVPELQCFGSQTFSCKVYDNLGSWLKRCTWDRASFCEGSRQKAEEFLLSAPKKKHKSNIKPGLTVLQRNHLIDSFIHWFASLVVIFADSVWLQFNSARLNGCC